MSGFNLFHRTFNSVSGLISSPQNSLLPSNLSKSLLPILTSSFSTSGGADLRRYHPHLKKKYSFAPNEFDVSCWLFANEWYDFENMNFCHSISMYYDIYVIHTCLTLFNRKSRRKTGGTTTVLGSTRPATTSTPPTRFSETCSDEESLPNTLRKGTGSIASSETTFFPRSSKSWPDTRSLTKFQETRQLQDPTEGDKFYLRKTLLNLFKFKQGSSFFKKTKIMISTSRKKGPIFFSHI